MASVWVVCICFSLEIEHLATFSLVCKSHPEVRLFEATSWVSYSTRHSFVRSVNRFLQPVKMNVTGCGWAVYENPRALMKVSSESCSSCYTIFRYLKMVPPQDMPNIVSSWTGTGQRGDFFQCKPWICAHTASAAMFKWRCQAVKSDRGAGTHSFLPCLLWHLWQAAATKVLSCWYEVLQRLSIKADRSIREQNFQKSFIV